MVSVAGVAGVGAAVVGVERVASVAEVEAGGEAVVCRGAEAVGNVTRSSPLAQPVAAIATAISTVPQTRVFM